LKTASVLACSQNEENNDLYFLEEEEMKKVKLLCVLLPVLLLALAAGNQAMGDVTLYYDNFDGAAGTDLHGTTPDITTGGATWVAGVDFDADGTVTYANVDGSLGDGAYLPFTPVGGTVYTLTAFIDTRPSPLRSNNPNDWIAMGFARTNTPKERRFYDDPGGANLPGGEYWMMTRTNLAVAPNYDQDFVGYRTNGGPGGSLTSSADNLKIVLNTSVAPWTVSWYFNGILDRTVNVGAGPPAFVNDPFGVGIQPISDFNYIMISNNRCNGFIDDVTLSIPEPATIALLALGGLLLRRKRA
jgi:hypothetical protein